MFQTAEAPPAAPPSADRLSATFAALADPTRRAILARLTLGEISVNDLAEPFDISLPAISKHLKVLERAGLVSRGRDAQRRPCRLAAEPLHEIANWIETYRRFWEQRFDRLEAYLHAAQQPASPGRSAAPAAKPSAAERSKAHVRKRR